MVNYDPPPAPPLDGQLTLNVADSALKGDSPDIALKVTQSILAKDPSNAQAWQRQGDAYFALGKIADAETSYRKALAAQSANTNSGFGLGSLPLIGNNGSTRDVIAAVRLGLGRIELTRDPAAAEKRFAEVVAADPRNATALNNLGIARDLRGRHPEAQDAYRKALAIAPDDLAAKVNLGLSLALSGNSEQAVELLQPLARRPDSTPRIRQDYAVALAMGGHTEDAVKVLRMDMSAEQAAAAVRGYRELPNTAPSRLKVAPPTAS